MEEENSKTQKDSLNPNEDLTLFDKNFFLVAAGVLTFTVTFIKDIVDIKTASWISCLFISWVLLGLAVAIIVITFYISASLTEHSKTDEESFDKEFLLAWKFGPRGISICVFLLGLLFLLLFVGRNFYLTNDPSKGNSTENKSNISSKKIDSLISKKVDSTIARIKPDTIFVKMVNELR